MKTYHMTGIAIPALALIAWLLAPQTAHCFYNTSTGRWISRDPLGDEVFGRGIPSGAKKRLPGRSTLTEDLALTFSAHAHRRAAVLTSGPRDSSSLVRNVSATVAIARETSNPYQFVHNAVTVYTDHLGLKPCSSCSAADIQREGIAGGLEYIHRTIEENREYGARICCNDCMSHVYSANVVIGPVGEGEVNLANSHCKFGDKIVADWHTHPDGSTQTGTPGKSSPDRDSTIGAARVYDCDFVGFMTNNHLDTTMMNGQGVETTVGTSSGGLLPAPN